MFPTPAKSHSPTVLSTVEAHKHSSILQAFSLELQTKYWFGFVCVFFPSKTNYTYGQELKCVFLTHWL